MVLTVLNARARSIAAFLLASALALPAFPAAAAAASKPGEVTLPLAEYLALVERVERIGRERAGQAAGREAPVAEVAAQRASWVVGEGEAQVTSELEVLVQGVPEVPVALPLAGLAERVEVRPAAGAALGAGPGGAVNLVAPGPGRYEVTVHGRSPLASPGGVARLVLAPVAAPVAVTEVDLPADLAWSCPGAVVVEERTEGARRKVRLTMPRGAGPTLELRRQVDGGEASRLLAKSVVLTIVQLRPEGPRRHDVVLYEVARGGLGSFAVELPPGLAVEQVATDEGAVVPVVEARRLAVHRKKQLAGTGWLVLTSTPAPGAAVPLAGVRPETEVRARYLALASSVAAEAHPAPEAAWSRVDLDDLPRPLGEALGALDLTAAWRLAAPAGEGLNLAVALLPAPSTLPALVRRRETTTLLTVDGTLLHRDRLTVARAGAALDLALPAGAVLWAARVGDQPVRPLDRGGMLSVPLGFADDGTEPVVEVVAVLERAIPPGRSELGLELPRLAAPVLAHEWRLLLPEGARYRYRGGDLRPAVELAAPAGYFGFETSESFVTSMYGPGGSSGLRARIEDFQGGPLSGVTVVLSSDRLSAPLAQVTDSSGDVMFVDLPAGRYNLQASLEGFNPYVRDEFLIPHGKAADFDIELSIESISEEITVTAEVPLIDSRRIHEGQTFRMDDRPAPRRRKEAASTDRINVGGDEGSFAREVDELRQGLVGGVKPLPVAIPEAGKALLLTGVLPPERVAVALEVRAKR